MWNPEIVPTGTWQSWVPAHPGDWPRYDDDHKATMTEGVIPPRCDSCGGLLKRRQCVSNVAEIRAVERTNERLIKQHSRDRATLALLPVPDEVLVWHYDLLHFRRCVGALEHPATPARDGLGSLDEAIAKSAFDPKQLRIVDQMTGGAA